MIQRLYIYQLLLRLTHKNFFVVLLVSLGLLATAQQKDIPGGDFRNNILKINLLPIVPIINGNNQKWIGFEYERFTGQYLSLTLMADAGLFEDYKYIKYHDYFNEDVGFSYTQTDAKTRGFHLISSVRYYFLAAKVKKGQGLYIGGNFDLNYYEKNVEVFSSLSNTTYHGSSSTTRISIGTTIGGQYVAFSRLVIDLNISIFAKLMALNSGSDAEEIKPLHATWIFANNTGWATVNLMIGYAFGGGKRK